MKKISLLTTFVFAALLTAAPLTEEKQLSKLPLMKWNCAVASAAKSSMKTPAGGATVECTYPIIFDESGKPKGTSWPRCNMRIPAAVQNWSGYDYLEFCVYTTFNRSDEEYLPVTIGIGGVKTRTLVSFGIKNLRQNQWVKVSVPLRSMKKNELVRSIQFHLNSRLYFPNDLLVLHVGDFKLVRLIEWQVLGFKMTAPAIFSDRTTLPVEYELLGPGSSYSVPFRISDSKFCLESNTKSIFYTFKEFFILNTVHKKPKFHIW
jgi:hypothetical protein